MLTKMLPTICGTSKPVYEGKAMGVLAQQKVSKAYTNYCLSIHQEITHITNLAS